LSNGHDLLCGLASAFRVEPRRRPTAVGLFSGQVPNENLIFKEMNPESPEHSYFPTFQEYKQNKEKDYSAEALLHYFNNELGTVSNLLAVLRARLSSATPPSEVASEILQRIDEINARLVTVHEIGNVGLDLLIQRENKG
jgi:hypothetical protein